MMGTGRRRTLTGLSCAAALLAGCANGSSVRLYDQSSAQVSSAVAQKFAAADLAGTVAQQEKNLDALLAEELQVIQENFALRRDITLLEIADNGTAIAASYRDMVVLPLRKLGVDASKVRGFLTAADTIALREEELEKLRVRYGSSIGRAAPQCADVHSTDVGDIEPEAKRRLAQRRLEGIGKACDEIAKLEATQWLSTGGIRRSEQAVTDARDRLAEIESKLASARGDVQQAAKAHGAAVDAAKKAGKTGEELRKAIKESADKLSSTLEKVAKAAPEALAEERLSALMSLLQAAAGADVNVEDDESLQRAVLAVGGLSSLSADLARLIAESRAPTVSNLLIELQHQTALLEHAREKRSIQRRRIGLLETRYRSFVDEADAVLRLRDALCDFAHLEAGGKRADPQACDGFGVVEDASSGTWTCEGIAGACALDKPWNAYLKSSPKGDAGREFYEALTQYLRLFTIRSEQIQANFRLTDLKHRENLAARDAALKTWHNLAAVPIEQLDGYFQSGLKPDEIADLLVKALGFTAITVGVSQ